jgi:hypothetical protein
MTEKQPLGLPSVLFALLSPFGSRGIWARYLNFACIVIEVGLVLSAVELYRMQFWRFEEAHVDRVELKCAFFPKKSVWNPLARLFAEKKLVPCHPLNEDEQIAMQGYNGPFPSQVVELTTMDGTKLSYSVARRDELPTRDKVSIYSSGKKFETEAAIHKKLKFATKLIGVLTLLIGAQLLSILIRCWTRQSP